MTPLITAIVPNYNHAPYLRQRLRSVLDQTVDDLELLFMDDASTDPSLAVFEPFRKDPRVRAMVNDRNTGSPFRQWNRGVAAARGRYIWIAESDDVADPRLLERVVSLLEANPQCGLGCCESWLLRGDGGPTAQNLQPIDRPQPRTAAWQQDFVADGRHICAHDMLMDNPIPNASAAVFRRALYEQLGGAPVDMRLCGDWLLWVRMLLNSGFAHVGDRLNYYRTHEHTVRARHRASVRTFGEVYHIMATVLEHADPPREEVDRALDWRQQWLMHELPRDASAVPIVRQVLRMSRQVDAHPWRRFARLAARRVGGRAKRSVAGALRRTDFLRRAAMGGQRERHETRARARGRLDALRWRLRNRRQDRPTLLVGMIEHMGDIIACEPVARHLRREHPDATIAWAVRPALRSLVEHHPDIDAIALSSCLTHWMMLRKHAGFDRVVDLHIHGRSCDDCIVTLDNARHTQAVNANNYYAHGPLLHCACSLAGLPRLDDTPQMHLPATVAHRVNDLQLPPVFAVVHARSSQPRRDWDDAKWRPLVRRLRDEAGLPVVEVGLEPALGDAGECRSLCGQLSILETAEVIRRASLFIGVDSGPAHMANAMGTPGVVLLGRYEAFDQYMPYTGRFAREEAARVIQWPEPAREIPVDHVFDAATSLCPAKVLAA